MAITDENGGNGFYMPVAPAYGGYGNNGGFGFGGDWGWIILLLLCANGGWGFGGGFGGFGGGLGIDFPWLLNGQQGINNNTNAGFRDAMLNDGINGIRDGINGISTQLCNGFNSAEIAANSRQMADMQQMFAIQSALQNCCCENRAATADLKYTVATENCADRQALNEGVRDILANQTAGIQRILDKLCDQELQAERRDNANLRSELMFARGQASQIEQTAAIRAAQATTANQLISELRSCPIPAQPVYGSQPIFTCGGNNCGVNCGCGVG